MLLILFHNVLENYSDETIEYNSTIKKGIKGKIICINKIIMLGSIERFPCMYVYVNTHIHTY